MWGEGIYLTPDYNRAKLYGDNVMPFYVRALVDNRTAKKTGKKKTSFGKSLLLCGLSFY